MLKLTKMRISTTINSNKYKISLLCSQLIYRNLMYNSRLYLFDATNIMISFILSSKSMYVQRPAYQCILMVHSSLLEASESENMKLFIIEMPLYLLLFKAKLVNAPTKRLLNGWSLITRLNPHFQIFKYFVRIETLSPSKIYAHLQILPLLYIVYLEIPETTTALQFVCHIPRAVFSHALKLLAKAQKRANDKRERQIPAIMLWGRSIEHLSPALISPLHTNTL